MLTTVITMRPPCFSFFVLPRRPTFPRSTCQPTSVQRTWPVAVSFVRAISLSTCAKVGPFEYGARRAVRVRVPASRKEPAAPSWPRPWAHLACPLEGNLLRRRRWRCWSRLRSRSSHRSLEPQRQQQTRRCCCFGKAARACYLLLVCILGSLLSAAPFCERMALAIQVLPF